MFVVIVIIIILQWQPSSLKDIIKHLKEQANLGMPTNIKKKNVRILTNMILTTHNSWDHSHSPKTMIRRIFPKSTNQLFWTSKKYKKVWGKYFSSMPNLMIDLPKNIIHSMKLNLAKLSCKHISCSAKTFIFSKPSSPSRG